MESDLHLGELPAKVEKCSARAGNHKATPESKRNYIPGTSPR